MHRQVEYESPEIISHILYAFRRRDKKEKCPLKSIDDLYSGTTSQKLKYNSQRLLVDDCNLPINLL